MSYSVCDGCNMSYKTGTGLSNHRRGCSMLIAKIAANSAVQARIQEQERMIKAQTKIIAEQMNQIDKLAARPTTLINNTMNINIVATEKVANAISSRFERFNLALCQWIKHRQELNAPIEASALMTDLQSAPDQSFLEIFNLICGKDQELEVDIEEEELAAADINAIEKHEDACIEESRKMLCLITN